MVAPKDLLDPSSVARHGLFALRAYLRMILHPYYGVRSCICLNPPPSVQVVGFAGIAPQVLPEI
jgi:hypothetical protein